MDNLIKEVNKLLTQEEKIEKMREDFDSGIDHEIEIHAKLLERLKDA